MRAVIFDLNRTLYDPIGDELYPGVRQMLEDLRGKTRLFIYSKRTGDRSGLMKRLQLGEHFEACYFHEHKTPENLSVLLTDHALTPQSCIVVGDLVDSELRAAGELGIETVWARHGIEPIELPPETHMPTYSADTMADLHKLLLVLI
ncbi:MAG TPA: HAD hydrolase-like protein [Candidatus Paceibacterota bacterium]